MSALVTVAAAAAELSMSPWTIRKWIARGRVPSVRLGRCVRIKRSDLVRLIESSTREAHPDLAMPGVEPGVDEVTP